MAASSRIVQIITLLSLAVLPSACTAVDTIKNNYFLKPDYRLTKTMPLFGDGHWDYVTVDEAARKVYITHDTKVDILDADSGKPIKVILNLHGVHGVAIAPASGHGFITNGQSDTVTVFNLKTLTVSGEIPVGRGPDAITYDPATKRVFVFNGDDGSATVINAAHGKVIDTIALEGAPEFAVPDGTGHVFVDLEDKDQVLELDAKKLKVLNRWQVAPGASPSSLALDRKNHRLFIGCRNQKLVVMSSVTGKVITSLHIGDHVDATAFDPHTRQVISSNGDGTMTVIQQVSANHYHYVATIRTPKGSRTFGLDTKTHALFVPAADLGPAPTPTADNPQSRPTITPGTFKVLIFER